MNQCLFSAACCGLTGSLCVLAFFSDDCSQCQQAQSLISTHTHAYLVLQVHIGVQLNKHLHNFKTAQLCVHNQWSSAISSLVVHPCSLLHQLSQHFCCLASEQSPALEVRTRRCYPINSHCAIIMHKFQLYKFHR